MLEYLHYRSQQYKKMHSYYALTYLSPFCKFPTPFASHISDTAHDIAPTPVYLKPFENLVLAFARAAKPMQVLI